MICEQRQHGAVTAWRAAVTLFAVTIAVGGCNDGETLPFQQTSSPPDSSASQSSPSEPAAPPTPKAKPQRIVDKTFDDLKFDIEPDDPFEKEMLSEEVESLFGKRIRIRGYIRPTFQRQGITQFIFVRDNLECCFGPGAALYDCIIVDMLPGKTASFTTRPVAVEGTFSLDEFVGPDGKHLAIFHLDGESVN